MDNQSKHKKLHVGSMITLRALEHYLDENKIPCYIKNHTESARLGGYAGIGSSDELLFYEEDFNKAKEILKTFLES